MQGFGAKAGSFAPKTCFNHEFPCIEKFMVGICPKFSIFIGNNAMMRDFLRGKA